LSTDEFAEAVGQYYHSLRKRGFPTDRAMKLTEAYQGQLIMSQVYERLHNDGEEPWKGRK